jgi:hypothetical protein
MLIGLRRILLRCLHLYLFQALLLVTVLAAAGFWIHNFGAVPEDDAAFLDAGLNGLRHGLTLQALPASLNILPLYIFLLALFPLIFGLTRLSPLIALAVSCALWIWANLDPSINLPNWLDGQRWYFDPFAWQFLFVIGAVGFLTLRRYGGDLPTTPSLRAAAWAYLGFALIVTAPWQAWGWSDVQPLPIELPDKTTLAPLRLLNVMALAFLVFGSPWLRSLAERPALKFLLVCGRHSLEVFSLGTILAMLFRLIFNTFGATPMAQLAANGLGLGAMIGLAMALEHWRHKDTAAKADRRQPSTAKSVASVRTI